MFKKTILTTLVATGLAAQPALATEQTPPVSREGYIGMGAGAIAGAVVAGPVGLIAGIVIGNLYGETVAERDGLDRETERYAGQVQSMEGQLAELRTENGRLYGERGQLARELAQLAELRESANLSESLTLDVLFRTGSDQLEAAARQRLTRLAEAARPLTALRVRLEGHADQRGGDAYNLDLSSRRAEAVKQALVAAGLSEDRIEVVAAGETGARAEGSDLDGLALDRRVFVELRRQAPNQLEAAHIKL